MAFKQSPCKGNRHRSVVDPTHKHGGCWFYLNFSVAFAAWRRQELLETIFAVQVTLFFNEADVNEFTLAAWVHTKEMGWTPGLSQSGDKRSSVFGEGRRKKVCLSLWYKQKVLGVRD
jgi:hypothetical protein